MVCQAAQHNLALTQHLLHPVVQKRSFGALPAVCLTSQRLVQVRLVEEARERLRKRQKEEARSKSAKAAATGGTAAARILEQVNLGRTSCRQD